MNTALIIIDIQNDYFPGGKMQLEGSEEAALKASGLLTVFRKAGLPVIHIQHISTRPGATFFLPKTTGVEIHKSVKPLEGEVIIQKNFPNSFRNTALLEFLNSMKIRKLILCGMMTHMCIDSTTRAAFDFGFDCTIAEDACATRILKIHEEAIPAREVHYAFLAALNSVYAVVMSCDEIIALIKNPRES